MPAFFKASDGPLSGLLRGEVGRDDGDLRARVSPFLDFPNEPVRVAGHGLHDHVVVVCARTIDDAVPHL